MVYGAQTPSRSRAEMEALTSIASIQSVMLPLGKLSVREEFPDLVAESASRPDSTPPLHRSHGESAKGKVTAEYRRANNLVDVVCILGNLIAGA
jgi:hypothetical protein